MVPRLDTRVDAIMAFQTVVEHAKTLERELNALKAERDTARQIAEYLRDLIPVKGKPLPWENSQDHPAR